MKYFVVLFFPMLASCSLLVNREPHTYDLDGGADSGPGPLAAPTLRFPWNGYMTGSALTGALEPPLNALRPRFIWEPTEGATSYQIQLSWHCEPSNRSFCDFAEPVNGTSTTNEWQPETPLDVLLVAPVGRRYFWRVQACRDAECFDWSEARYLDVGRMPTDFNADGYADVLVGETGSAAVAAPTLFEGPSLSGTGTRMPELPDGGHTVVVSTAGDVDADGYPDFLVVSSEARVAYLYRNRAGYSDPIIAGDSVPSGGGDLNADGYADFIVADPDEVEFGRARVFFGSALGVLVATGREVTSPNPETNGKFGATVSLVADLDGDGYCDALVGAPFESGGAVAGSGRTYIYHGSPEGGMTELTLSNPEPATRTGFGFVSSGGDVNCDGFGDFVIAAAQDGDSDPGVYVFLGGRTRPYELDTVLGTGGAFVTLGLGTYSSLSRDIDGDGSADIVASLDVRAATVSSSGAGVWFGSCASSVMGVPLGLEGVTGEFVMSVDDIDQDGLGEIVGAAPTTFSVRGWDGVAIVEERSIARASTLESVAGPH